MTMTPQEMIEWIDSSIARTRQIGELDDKTAKSFIQRMTQIRDHLARTADNTLPMEEIPEGMFLFPVLYFPSSKEPQYKFYGELKGYPYSVCAYGDTPAAAMRAAFQKAKEADYHDCN